MEAHDSQGTPEVLGPSSEAPARNHAPKPYRFERRRPDSIRFALHDRLGPALANLELRLGLLEEHAGEHGFSQEQVTSLKQEVAGLVEELGRIVNEQLPKPLELGGLVRAMREACRRAERPGTLIDFTVSGTPVLLPRETAELLYRAVLEGTANVARHAHARRCLVKLTFSATHVALEVRDNGRGSPPADPASPAAHVGLGLTSLWRAARRLHGSVRLESLPVRGTRLVARLPLDASTPRPHLTEQPPPAPGPE
ncbi:MAG: ATP-binding protein [Trueperaceae bacterium]